jgi:extradiol dioxygenase family protein
MFVAFAELPVFDQIRARAFYIEKLGCDVVADAPMGTSAWRWIEVGFPRAQTGLHFVRRQNEEMQVAEIDDSEGNRIVIAKR